MLFEDWGQIDYSEASAQQLEVLERVAEGEEERLIFCTHPPVVTLGRATSEEDIIGWSGPLLETSRGGRATYHGPSQIVIYPILDLRRQHSRLKERDIHVYLRTLEETAVLGLHQLGLPLAERRETPEGEILRTGVWVGEKKIASIGIAVRKWCTYHGVAINILRDPMAHAGIKPCGFAPGTMTSLEEELGRTVDVDECKSVLRRVFEAGF